MNRQPDKKPHGQLRQSQVVTTFGPGALVDLPRYSGLVSGLDHWSQGREPIQEARLVEKLKRLLEVSNLSLYAPPIDPQDYTAPKTGLTVWQFPEWFITQDVEQLDQRRPIRSRLLVHRRALNRGKFVDQDRVKRTVVPVRFVRACRRGHIGDVDWYAFVHRGATQCRRQLRIDERGTSGDLSEIWVRCECGQERQMNEAALSQTKALGNCDGSRPWLGPYTKETCGELNRLLVRTASNAYFPQLMRVISLPDRDEDLVASVNQVWEDYLANVKSVEQTRVVREMMPRVKAALEGFSDEEVYTEISSRLGGGGPGAGKSVKQAELEVLSAAQEEIGSSRPDGTFYARALPRERWDQPWMAGIERVVLVYRLREVVAQVGFTRFEAAAPDVEGELDIGVKRAALAREITWLPAVENRGEGIFLGFSREAIDSWLLQPAVVERGKQLTAGFDSWMQDHQGSQRKFLGLPYILLHSLSHGLITTLSLECGYPASSIRERIYAGSAGYGILLYTATADAEGTLGGLVETGRQIARYLRSALELAELCSNDPVCAHHIPNNTHEHRFLHGAACHGCLLIAETSCEQYNDFLDRSLVVQTVESQGAEFFKL